MPVLVTVYYRDGKERHGEMEAQAARLDRRIDLLGRGRKLEAALERAENLEEHLDDMDVEEATEKMRNKFYQDMGGLAKSCRAALAGVASLLFRSPGNDGRGRIVWRFRNPAMEAERVIDTLMRRAGLRRVGGKIWVQYEYSENDLAGSGACNAIRLATEAAARIISEVYNATQASDTQCSHTDHGEVLREAEGEADPYLAVRTAALVLAGVRRQRRGRTGGAGGGLHMAVAQWLDPDVESSLWVRETIKWLQREGVTDKGDIEAEVGARVANNPDRDSELFNATIKALRDSGVARFDGRKLSLSLPRKKGE